MAKALPHPLIETFLNSLESIESIDISPLIESKKFINDDILWHSMLLALKTIDNFLAEEPSKKDSELKDISKLIDNLYHHPVNALTKKKRLIGHLKSWLTQVQLSEAAPKKQQVVFKSLALIISALQYRLANLPWAKKKFVSKELPKVIAEISILFTQRYEQLFAPQEEKAELEDKPTMRA